MKATEANLLKFMQKPKQMLIPIYQRKYSWGAEQCQKLWDDIENVAKHPNIKSHFLGSVVYIDDDNGNNIVDVARYLLIDGQQRLTTMSIFLHALASVLDDAETTITKSKINNYYLFNNEETGELRYKLLPTETDKETLLAVLDNEELPEEVSPNIVKNYHFFLEQLKRSSLTPYDIYQAVAKLMIVDTSLTRDTDDPQLIFESLNSTGLDLSQTDLIRNYILMGLDSNLQGKLYNQYWKKIERAFAQSADVQMFDRFMKDYLSIKTGVIPKKNAVYQHFVRYVLANRGEVSTEQLVQDIYAYAMLYASLHFFDGNNTEKAVVEALKDIKDLGMDLVNPFLLHVYHDYKEKNIITQAAFLSVVRLVESFLFRRSICDIPTQGLNLRFVQYIKEIDTEQYVESVHAALLNGDDTRNFPKDEQFQEALLNKNVYGLRNVQYLLTKLENVNRKEKVSLREYTIEHIMPQNENVSIEWQDALGDNWEEVHTTYLHTLGNLTLTGYNSEYSDKPFPIKRDMEGGFAESPLHLNKGLANVQVWNEESIIARAKKLGTLCCYIWSHPNISSEALAKYGKKNKRNITIEDHTNKVSENVTYLFEELRTRIYEMDSNIHEKVNKQYVAYRTKNNKNIVSIVFQMNKLKLNFLLEMDDVKRNIVGLRDVTNVSTWGRGDVELDVETVSQIDDAMVLIEKAYQKQKPKTKRVVSTVVTKDEVEQSTEEGKVLLATM